MRGRTEWDKAPGSSIFSVHGHTEEGTGKLFLLLTSVKSVNRNVET